MCDSDHPIVSRLSRAGIRRGDTVAVQSENSGPFAELVLTCWRLGAVVVPISTRYPGGTVKSILDDFSVQAFFASGDFHTVKSLLIDDFVGVGGATWTPEVLDKSNIDLQADASIILTSGSSAKPKAVLHSLENHYYSALGANDNIPFGDGDRWLASLPMYHISGFSLIMRAWLHGGTVVFPAAKQPLAESIRQYDITHLSVVPTQLAPLLDDPVCVQKLKRFAAVLLGGAAIPLALIQKAVTLGLPIYRTYGSTEAASQIATTCAKDCFRSHHSAGRILPHRQVKLASDGEVMVKGPVLFKGYVRGNRVISAVDDDGFFQTGDVGYFDDDNRLCLTGRKDMMFISGGENIHPEEVEQVIGCIESVEQVVVVPVEDARFGYRPVAFIKVKQGMRFDPARAEQFLQDRLERFKIPDQFLPWPREADLSLKPDRGKLRAFAAEQIRLKAPPEHF